MLIKQIRAAVLILPRTPRSRLHENLDAAGGRHAEKPQAEEAAQLQDPGVTLAPAPAALPAHVHGKPDFVASRHAINPLKQELEIGRELELADDHKPRPL